VGPSRRAAALVSFSIALGGCAALTGISDFVKDDCADGCEGGADATLEDADSGSDVRYDGKTDAGPDAIGDGARDVGSDVTCGPPGTITNCGGCGNVCDTTQSAGASCNGTTCQYGGCLPGFSNCNTTPPDTNGCECATPSCCGSTCESTHSDGLGQVFLDCVPPYTYNLTQATEACTAYGGGASCAPSACNGGGSNRVVCGTNSTGLCACWNYSGSFVGTVFQDFTSTCKCPGAGSLTWY